MNLSIPPEMTAVRFHRFGGPEVLEVERVPTPEAGVGEVLIKVEAVSIGRLLDLVARAGNHPFARFDLPHILGAEHAGTVAALGPGVTGVKVGERVAVFPVLTCGRCDDCLQARSEACQSMQLVGVHRAGAYAEYSRVPASSVHPIPAGVHAFQASALALSGPVAWHQLRVAGVGRGTWVLVQAGASALGSLTAEVARHLGARVIVTSRVAWKRERLAELGYQAVLDSTEPDCVDEVHRLTGGRGADVVVDDIGDPTLWDVTIGCLARRGTVVSSGAFAGGKVTLDLRSLYTNSQRIIGIRTGNPATSVELWRAVDEGLRAVVDRVFPLEEAAKAHEYVERDENFGRVILQPDAAAAIH